MVVKLQKIDEKLITFALNEFIGKINDFFFYLKNVFFNGIFFYKGAKQIKCVEENFNLNGNM